MIICKKNQSKPSLKDVRLLVVDDVLLRYVMTSIVTNQTCNLSSTPLYLWRKVDNFEQQQ